MTKEKMQIIDDIVNGNDVCVLATSDGIELMTSLRAYVVDHATMKFYFLVEKDSSESKNIKKHPHVSLLIDQRNQNFALTIQGVYSPLTSEQTGQAITKLFLAKHPELKDFAESHDAELLRIAGKSASLAEGFSKKFSTKFKNS